jgi:type II secretion system protein G
MTSKAISWILLAISSSLGCSGTTIQRENEASPSSSQSGKVDDIQSSSKREATRALITQIAIAVDLFRLNHGRYPENLADLVKPPPYVDVKGWPPGGYLLQPPKDGWGREFVYRVPGRDGQPYSIISLGADGREGGLGFAEDISINNQ